ncbi:MAG: hypothetical protein Q8P24_04820 [Desulfobacterales bacterium]|nr:hypothetical protein [Desulfobacterales bacterium]
MSVKNEPGGVKVLNGGYKISGCFHRISPSRPVRDQDGRLMGVTNPRDITHIHMYGGEAVFFESLPEGRLMASRCGNSGCETAGSIYMPFRTHCPDCLGRNTPVDITDLARKTATVYSFMTTERTGAFNTLKVPIKFINIAFDGVCTILMGYLSVGEPAIGLRLKPIFRTKDPTFTILDLSWVPSGTPEPDLPDGFSY